MKKLLIWTLILLLVTSLSIFSYAKQPISDSLAKEQKESNLQYNSILKNYCDKNKNKVMLSNEITFPEFYGGSYLDKDKKLVVLLTDDMIEYKNELKTITKNNELKFEKVKYSYNHLNKIMDTINEYMISNQNSNDELSLSINSASLTEDMNCVVVKLKNYNQSIISLFNKKISNSNAIVFEEATDKDINKTYAETNPGEGIIVNSSLSCGYKSKYWDDEEEKWHYGYVTAGHGTSIGHQVNDRSSGVVIGEIIDRVYTGSCDASFIETNFEPSSTIAISGAYQSDEYTDVAVGSFVCKVGYATSLTSADVLSINFSAEIDGIWCTNLVKTENMADEGDSGGIVYDPLSGGFSDVAGIIKGGNIYHTYSYYTKASVIDSELGAVPN